MLASAIKKIILALIRVYQVLTINRQACCRFTPTCSHYAIEAIDKHGAIQGSYLTIQRLMRCHPLGAYGYDPIP